MSVCDGEENKEDIDEKRLNRRAYDYLCRLLEVRNWLAECLQDESIASVTELENNFRNGVVLARLGNAFAPDSVPLRSIFDINQQKYHENEDVPVYRHTDNIMYWRRAMQSVRLPEIVMPETADVFEGRNIQTVFCLYALAFLLYRLRKAPPLRNLAGKAVFSSDELEGMKEQLKDSHLPEFGDVGGLLSGMTSDEKAQAEAIQSINTAIDNEDADQLLTALQQPDAGILYVEKDLKKTYLVNLKSEKQKEENNTVDKKQIQDSVIETNNSSALSELHHLLFEPELDEKTLLRLLDMLQFEEIREFAVSLYISSLRHKKAANLGKPLTREQVGEAIHVSNALAEVKLAVQQGTSEDTYKALSNPVLELQPRQENGKLYYNRLRYDYEKSSTDFFLSKADLQNIVYEFEDISTEHRSLLELKSSCERGDSETIEYLLRELCGTLYVEENIEYYIRRLKCVDISTVDDLLKAVADTNQEVHDAFVEADSMVRLNSSMARRDASGTRLHLMAVTSSVGCKVFRRELVHWYVNRLMAEAQKRKHLDEEKVQNGNVEYYEWLEHSFTLGSVFVEIEEHKRSTKREVPEKKSYLKWPEVQSILAEENANFTNHYKENEEKVIKSQEATRKFLEHRRRKLADFRQREMDMAAKTIQDNYKKYRQRVEQEELKSCDAPSLSLVRKFVDCLHDREQDVIEELSVEEQKSRVWQLRVSNQQLDNSLRSLDNKIGLLIKNRLNLQDVIAHKDKIADETDRFAFRPATLRKKARDQQDYLEKLFYHLQTDSMYMANLVQSTERKEIEGFHLLEDCVAPVYGFLTEKREQFLLVRLLCEIMLRNVEKMDKLNEFSRTNDVTFIQHVLTSNMFDVVSSDPCCSISDELKVFLADEISKNVFNLDPNDIYSSVYGKKAATIEEAVADERVEKVLTSSKEFLAKWSLELVRGIISKYKLPPHVLYVTCFLNDILRRQLPNATTADIQRTIGEFIFEVYLRGFLVSPRAIFRASGHEMKEDAVHKLETVVLFMGYAIANKGYGNSTWYMTSLNKEIHIIYEEFRNFIFAQTLGVRLDDVYGMNEYTQFDHAHKPSLTLVERQLHAILKYLKLNAPELMGGTNSPLHDLLSKCSSPEMEGERTILLHLHPLDGQTLANTEKQELFVRTKKYVIDVILSGCEGADLPALLSFTPSEHNEALHNEKFNPEKMPSLAAKQAEIQKSLDELATVGRVSAEDNYQSIVTDIANDIRLATRRRKERSEKKISMVDTEKTLMEQREELKSRLVQYEEYLDTCLENLSRTSKRLSIRSDTKYAGKIQKERRSLDVPQSFKCSAEKLFRKGILVDVVMKSYESPKKIAKLNLDIASTEKRGIFKITVFDGKHVVNEFDLDFQDLLQCESSEEQRYTLPDKSIIFDVPRTIQYINKKFYSK